MKPPENLVKAVERLKPRAILLLDTNILMDNPRLESYEVAAPGQFLFVVPQVVDNELLSLTFNSDQRKRQKASRAREHLGELYEQGNPADVIDLGNDVWMMTVRSPRPASPDGTSLEDDQIWRYLGQVDAALLRLADACAEDIPDTRTILTTKDKNLIHVARGRGLGVCSWPNLRASEILEQLLSDSRPGGVLDIDTHFCSLLDSNEERPVNIAMTLEKLRSEEDRLIARGVGNLTYDEQRHPFRWTFPYRNVGKAEDFDSMWEMAQDAGSMPIENVDFMGADEKIPEQVRRLVCPMLEGSASYAAGGPSLQSPNTQVRLGMGFLFDMEWGEFIPIESLPKELYPDLFSRDPAELEAYSRICARHNQHILSLRNGTAKNVGDTYIKVFRSQEQLSRLLGVEPEPEGNDLVMATLESGLSSIIYDALDTWAVGETQESELGYRPFAWAEEGENGEELESEDHQDYEEFEDDEDEPSESED